MDTQDSSPPSLPCFHDPISDPKKSSILEWVVRLGIMNQLHIQKERRSLLSPSPIPPRNPNSSPLTTGHPLSLQRLELGRKEEEIAFKLWALLLLGSLPSHSYAPHWSVHLTG